MATKDVSFGAGVVGGGGRGWGEFDEIGVFLTKSRPYERDRAAMLADANMQMKQGGGFLWKPVACEKSFTPSLLILINACKPHLYKSNKSNLAAPVNGYTEQQISATVKISHINSV